MTDEEINIKGETERERERERGGAKGGGLTSRVLVCTKGENDHENTLSKRNRLG